MDVAAWASSGRDQVVIGRLWSIPHVQARVTMIMGIVMNRLTLYSSVLMNSVT